MRLHETIETPRLLLRKPLASDAAEIYRRYAADPEVTRYLSWPTHRSIADTQAFLAWSDAEWARWPAGPYLAYARGPRPGGEPLLGATGLAFDAPDSASTGYVFARDAWGQGFATEALRAMIGLARQTGVAQLQAICHWEHAASARVLRKGGLAYEGILAAHTIFPNLAPGIRADVLSFALRP